MMNGYSTKQVGFYISKVNAAMPNHLDITGRTDVSVSNLNHYYMIADQALKDAVKIKKFF